MSYEVQFSDKALKALRRIDHYQARLIILWIEKNLAGCSNPRIHGKALIGDKKGYWRYRVGSYRIISDIKDNHIKIEIINVAHRSEAYE